jgi:hypothetical protein
VEDSRRHETTALEKASNLQRDLLAFTNRVADSSGAVTGGTYANARGVFLSKEVKGGSLDTITLAG